MFNIGHALPLRAEGFCVRELVAVETRNVREESMFHGQNTGLSTTAAQSGTVHGLDLSVSANCPCPRSVRQHRHGHNHVTGIAEMTFPPLLSASKSIATPRSSATLMSPPDTSS